MSQQNTGDKSFLADAAIDIDECVKITATGVDVAGTGDGAIIIGNALKTTASGEQCPVRMIARSNIGVASGTVLQAANLYPAAGGALANNGSLPRVGIALEGVTTGQQMEYLPVTGS